MCPSIYQRTARGKGPRSWQPWPVVLPEPGNSHHPNKALCATCPASWGDPEGRGAAHGRAQPHVAIYIEFIYIHVRQTPRPRHRYVHKAKCKYLNALNTELKKRALHNTARGPGPPGPTRRQHDGTARTTHTQCPPSPPPWGSGTPRAGLSPAATVLEGPDCRGAGASCPPKGARQPSSRAVGQ